VLHPVYVTRKLLYRLSEIEALEADGTGGPDE
jgi:hypothetical protein